MEDGNEKQIQIQIEIEELFSKLQLLPKLRDQFFELAEKYPVKESHGFICDMLTQIYLHRQADVLTLVGVLSPKHGTPQEVADKLLLMCEFDYLDFDEVQGKFLVKYDVSEDIVEMLARYQYPLPMIMKPNTVEGNMSTGYFTIRGSIVLNGSTYFKDKDMCLDHINRANSVALALDFSVLESNEGKYIKPTRNVGEDFVEFKKRLKQSSVFYETSVEVMKGLNELSDTLYLTHKYDRRGRCYSSGYHVNTQGTDYNKAVLQFAKKEVVR